MSAPNRKLKCSTEMSSWKKKWKETESDREGKCKGSCKGLFPDLETLEAGMILGPSWWAFIPKSRTIFLPPVMLNWSGSLWRVVRKRECSAAVLWLFNLAAQTYDLMGSPTGKLFQCKDENWVNTRKGLHAKSNHDIWMLWNVICDGWTRKNECLFKCARSQLNPDTIHSFM